MAKDLSRFIDVKKISFLSDPVMGERLVLICKVLLDLKLTNATAIFGSPDDKKLKSSMTLFLTADQGNDVFQQVLDKFFHSEKDKRTVDLLETAV